MGNSVERKDAKRGGLFSKEVIGMALILFSVLTFLCLFIGDSIYPVGTYVRGFVLGVFGYYSILFLALVILLGVKLVIGKSVFPKQVKMLVLMLNVTLCVIFAIVHITVFMRDNLSFGERIAFAFGGCAYNLSNATAGGAVFSFVAHPILQLLRPLGAYILLAIVGLLCILYFVNKFNFTKGEKKGKKSKGMPETPSLGVQQPIASMGASQAQQTSHRPQLFIYGQDNQGRGKKSKRNGAGSMSYFPFAVGNGSAPTQSSNGSQAFNTQKSYSQSYGEDFDDKLKYITTPQKPNISNFGQQPMGYGNASQRRFDRREEQSAYGEEGTRDVFRINDEAPSPQDSFGRANDDYQIRRTDYSEARRDTIGDVRNNPSSGPFGSIFDRSASVDRTDNSRTSSVQDRTAQRNIFSGASQERSINRVNDRFINTDFTAKDKLLNGDAFDASKAVRSSGFSEQSPNDPSSKAYNPYKTDMVETPRVTRENDRSVQADRFSQTGRTVDGSSSLINDNLGRVEKRGIDESRTGENKINESRLADTDGDLAPTRVPRSVSAERNRETVQRPRETAFSQEQSKAQDEKAVEKKSKAPLMPEQKPNPIDIMPANYRYKAPPLSILNDYLPDAQKIAEERAKQQARAEVIVRTFGNKGIEATVEDIIFGPTVTRFVVSVPQNVSMKVVAQTQPDLNVWLETVTGVRMLIPIPGTSKIGIEVANSAPTIVGLKEILSTKQARTVKPNSTTFVLGKGIIGDPILVDIRDMPHVIIAGATGTGKSVCLNSMLVSLLYRYGPEDLRLIIVDPKFIEFTPFEGIPHLMFNEIITDPARALPMLDWATQEMDRRYLAFKDVGVRNLVEYNTKAVETGNKKIPYIVILIDEFNELMMTAGDKKKVEGNVTRLAQKARAAGISLVFATQRPSADVIDGSIKTNFTSRICFKTSTNVDSQVVIGQTGAETLVGKGDVLFKVSNMPNVERAQGSFISTEEVYKVAEYVRNNNKCYFDERALDFINKAQAVSSGDGEMSSSGGSGRGGANVDPDAVEDVYLRALRLIILTRNVSKTSLQSKLGIGYPKAAKIIDWMEEQGFISEQIDNKQRSIYITREEYEKRFGEFEESWK